MTAHVAVPALAPPELPATLAPAIVTGLLRDELGFKGLVITDALDMDSIAKGYSAGDAAVRSLEAGADVLLMPPDPDAAIRAVVAAVESGRLTRSRIRESVVKVLAAKERVGLDRKRFVDVEAIGDVINSPEANDKAQEIADRAVTLVRNGVTPERINTGPLVPLAAPDRACYLVLAEGRYSNEGETFLQELRKRVPKALAATLDPSMTRETMEQAVLKLPGCDTYAVAAFSSAAAYRGTVGLSGDLPQWLQGLIAAGKPVVLVALGDPYLLRSFPDVPAYLATFSTSRVSEIAAVRALLGDDNITGHFRSRFPAWRSTARDTGARHACRRVTGEPQ